MAGETVITVVGNLTADPELRYTQNGLPVANFTIASTPRTFDRQANEWKDGDALFLRASVWREFAEHVAGSLTKGMRVIAQGRLRQRSYQDREGATAPRSSWRSTRSAPRSGTRPPRSPVPPRTAAAGTSRVAQGGGRPQQQPSRGAVVDPRVVGFLERRRVEHSRQLRRRHSLLGSGRRLSRTHTRFRILGSDHHFS